MAAQVISLARHDRVVIIENGLYVSFPGCSFLLADSARAIRIELSAITVWQQGGSASVGGGVICF